MLHIKQIRENYDKVIFGLAKRKINAEPIINEVLTTDDIRKTTQNNLDNIQAELNTISKSIGKLMQEGKKDEVEQAKNRTAELKEKIKQLSDKLSETETDLTKLLTQIPNVPHESVPVGHSAEDNIIIRSGGQIRPLGSNAVPHWELAQKYDIIDFELGVKITGAGFPVYKGQGAKLQRALINFFLDEANLKGFTEVQPPIVINEDSGFGTGQLPDKEGLMYHITEENLFLVPTAEVPLTNIYRDVILEVKGLPVKITAYTPCFRREAGSYGKDVRGLNRLHQFDKVEIVCISKPEESYKILEEMVNYVETLVQKLELPYRIIKLCGGDMGFCSALSYDFEVWSAAQERWLEVSSVSNFESFQSNRLKLRYKDPETKKTVLAHTLNGSALALPRIVAALLENNQTEKGIKIPEILKKYTGFEMINT